MTTTKIRTANVSVWEELTRPRTVERQPSKRTIERQEFWSALDQALQTAGGPPVVLLLEPDPDPARRLTQKNRIRRWAASRGYRVRIGRVRKDPETDEKVLPIMVTKQ